MAAGKLMHGVGVVSDAAFDALASQSLGKDQADTVISVSRVILGVYAGSLMIGNISVIVDGDLTVGHLVGAFVISVVWGHLGAAMEVQKGENPDQAISQNVGDQWIRSHVDVRG